ncbi:zinc finger fyve/phd-type [Holotrichia oblita]|uniref:Zinc finger fyve/phd-type n=1 Tax=Holotrichia oblita TaxID=644536 RepID=A0ACB9TNL9_HOLOL|nr:zinc finger fyve/phd-type [Holotrichia oblita]
MDESGLQLNNKPTQVLAAKGSKNVSSLTSGEKGETTSVIGCCNAEEMFLPPYVIFKGKNRKDEYLDGMPHGSQIAIATGIAPFNPDAIPDHAYITIQMEQDAEATSHGSNSTVKNSSPPSPPPQLTTVKATNTRISSPLPGCSHDPANATVDINPSPEKLLENVISPIPKTSAKAVVKTRGRQLAIILNSSERIKIQKHKTNAKKKKNVVKQKKPLTSSDSDSESPVLQESDTSVAEEWDENECAGCGENYFETSKNEDWIKCVNCSRWLHSGCSKFENFCDLCGKMNKKSRKH